MKTLAEQEVDHILSEKLNREIFITQIGIPMPANSDILKGQS